MCKLYFRNNCAYFTHAFLVKFYLCCSCDLYRFVENFIYISQIWCDCLFIFVCIFAFAPNVSSVPVDCIFTENDYLIFYILSK